MKYEYFGVHFSHQDGYILENNELEKWKGYENDFIKFAEEVTELDHTLHRAYQSMKRIKQNRQQGGGAKNTPVRVNTYGILSSDADKALRTPSQVQQYLSYLSARQKWIIQKYVCEAVVRGIEAGLAHRSRLAQDAMTSPHKEK